jgi:hypothetical protein
MTKKSNNVTTTLPVGSFVRTDKGLLLKIVDTRYVQHKKGLEIGYNYKLILCNEDKDCTESTSWISNFDYSNLIVVEKDAWFLPEKSEVKNAVELDCVKKQGGSDRYTYLLELTNGLFVKISDIFWGPLGVETTYTLVYSSPTSFNVNNRSTDLDWIVATESEAKQLLVEELI